MKQTINREKKLPAFTIDINELELLRGEVLALFDKPEEVQETIEIELKSFHMQLINSKLIFNSFNEFKEHPLPQIRIKNFKILLSQGGRDVCISSQKGSPKVSASADSIAWCGGAITTVDFFISQRVAWFHMMKVYKYLWLASIICLQVNYNMAFFKQPFYNVSNLTIIGIVIFLIANNKLLPSSIVATKKSNFFWLPGEIILALAFILEAILALNYYMPIKKFFA